MPGETIETEDDVVESIGVVHDGWESLGAGLVFGSTVASRGTRVDAERLIEGRRDAHPQTERSMPRPRYPRR